MIARALLVALHLVAAAYLLNYVRSQMAPGASIVSGVVEVIR